MLDCIADTVLWCNYRGLKINTEKVEVIRLGSRQRLAKLSRADKELVLTCGALSASVTARNLGV